MEFIVSSSDLLNQLNTVKSVINSKNALPILDDFLFTLSDKKLKIEATDLETRLETTMTLENANGGGVFAVPAKKLTDMLNLFADEPLTFKVNLDTYEIQFVSASGEYKLSGESGEDFPHFIPLEESKKASFSISSEYFQRALSKTVFASSDDDPRPIMNGILIELTNEHLRLVATDSHKLARYTRTDIKVDTPASFVFPKKPANLLKGILAKESNDVVVEFDDKQVVVNMASYIMSCRMIDGKYPNYSAAIPKDNPNKLIVNKDDFYRKLRRVSFFSDSESNMVKLAMTGSSLVINAQDLNTKTSAKESMSCQFEGDSEDMQIGFKSKFLLTILDNINSEDVCMEMSDPSRAGLISPIDKDDENEDVLMLLMPMML